MKRYTSVLSRLLVRGAQYSENVTEPRAPGSGLQLIDSNLKQEPDARLSSLP